MDKVNLMIGSFLVTLILWKIVVPAVHRFLFYLWVWFFIRRDEIKFWIKDKLLNLWIWIIAHTTQLPYWRVKYKDGNMTRLLGPRESKSLKECFGGKRFIDYEWIKKKRNQPYGQDDVEQDNNYI